MCKVYIEHGDRILECSHYAYRMLLGLSQIPTQSAQAILHDHEDHILRQERKGSEDLSLTVRESSTVNPHHDRQV